MKILTTIVYYIGFIALGLASASLGPTLPWLAENTNTTIAAIGFLFTARSLGFLVGALLLGRLYDRVKGHVLLGIMVLLMSLSFYLTPLVSVLWLLTVVLFFGGIADSGVDVGTNTLIMWVHPTEVGPYLNGLHFFFGVGAFLAPIIVAQVMRITDGSIIWTYWVLATLMFPVGLLVFLLRSPTPRRESSNQDDAPTNYGLVALIGVFYFLYVGAEVGFGGWIFTYAVSLELANEENAAYLTAGFWGMLTVGRLLSIPIAMRFRPRAIMLTDLIGALLSLGIILMFPGSLVAVWIGTLGFGLSMASIFPTMLAMAERRMAITGFVTGCFFVGASSGAMVLPSVLGYFLTELGAQSVILSVLGSMTLAMLLFFYLLSLNIQSEVGSRE